MRTRTVDTINQSDLHPEAFKAIRCEVLPAFEYDEGQDLMISRRQLERVLEKERNPETEPVDWNVVNSLALVLELMKHSELIIIRK